MVEGFVDGAALEWFYGMTGSNVLNRISGDRTSADECTQRGILGNRLLSCFVPKAT